MSENLHAVELVPGGGIWRVSGGSEPRIVDEVEWSCSCPDWEHRRRHTRDDCKHMAHVRALLEERTQAQTEQQFLTAKALKRVTGKRAVPAVAGVMTEDQLKAIFA